jgi:ribose 1,5-bisphosphokinase PhnN
LANVSRGVIDRARERYAGTRVVFVKVPYTTTAARLEHRGRELPNSIGYNARLLRARRNPGHPSADYVLDNGGDIDTAVEHLSDYMMSQREDAALNRHYLTGVQS